jgi:hypothetical protein
LQQRRYGAASWRIYEHTLNRDGYQLHLDQAAGDRLVNLLIDKAAGTAA